MTVTVTVWPRLAQRRLHPGDTLLWGRRIQFKFGMLKKLKYLSVGLKLKLTGGPSVRSYPTSSLSDVPNLMESLDSGHATVKTENSQPVSVKAGTLAHESYCGVLGGCQWLQRSI